MIFTFGNGVPMSLRAAREIEAQARLEGARGRPALAACRSTTPRSREHARDCKRILVVDEGRRSAGVGEGIITAIVEAGHGAKPLQRVVGVDTYTPLAGAAFLVIPSDDDIVAAAETLVAKP